MAGDKGQCVHKCHSLFKNLWQVILCKSVSTINFAQALGRSLNTAGTRAAINTSVSRLQTGVNLRLTTAAGSSCGDGGRPMTSVRAAGYSSIGRRISTTMGSGTNWPAGQMLAESGQAPPLEVRSEDSPEEKIKIMEKRVSWNLKWLSMGQGVRNKIKVN